MLLGRRGPRPIKGFFDPDNFTFGTPLRRSALESAIQSVSCVRAVLTIRKRERALLPFEDVNELIVDVAPDEVFVKACHRGKHPSFAGMSEVPRSAATRAP